MIHEVVYLFVAHARPPSPLPKILFLRMQYAAAGLIDLTTCAMSANFFVQTLFVGGLFQQFRLNSEGEYIISRGTRTMAAVLMAINKVNNKSDGVYDNLLPNTQVCCGSLVLARYLQKKS